MSSCCGLRSGSAIMETELTSKGRGFGSIFGSTVKSRPTRFQTSGLCFVSDIDFNLFRLLVIWLICRLVHALLTFFSWLDLLMFLFFLFFLYWIEFMNYRFYSKMLLHYRYVQLYLMS